MWRALPTTSRSGASVAAIGERGVDAPGDGLLVLEVLDRDHDDAPAEGLEPLTAQVIALALFRIALVVPAVVLDDDLPAQVDQVTAGDLDTARVDDRQVGLWDGQPGRPDVRIGSSTGTPRTNRDRSSRCRRCVTMPLRSMRVPDAVEKCSGSTGRPS